MTSYSEAGAPLNLRCHLLDVTDRVLTGRELRRRTEDRCPKRTRRLREINADLQRLKESYRDLLPSRPRHLLQPGRPRSSGRPATRQWC